MFGRMQKTLTAAVLTAWASSAQAAYTPLIETTFLDGVKTDLTTAATGILTLVVIVLGVRWLITMFK